MIPTWVPLFLSRFAQIIGIITGIQSAQAEQATAATAEIIREQTLDTQLKVNDSVIGLGNINVLLNSIISDIGASEAAILTAISAIPVTGVPVTLPSAPPPGWITPFGDAVWGWPVPTTSNPAFTFLQHAGDGAIQRGEALTQDTTAEADALFVVNGVWGFDNVSTPNPNSTTTLDVSTILASDATSADWLLRVYPTVPWQPIYQNGCLSLADVGSTNWNWVVDLPIDKWLQLKANLGLLPGSVSAPIWPGIAGVTLGTPATIAPGLVVAGPMSGVIVAITGTPAKTGFFDFGTSPSYRNLGAISFQDDNGEQEPPQNLGFAAQMYVCRTMVSAANCLVRVVGGVTGTITPFTIP
jgi:hypothetical protein